MNKIQKSESNPNLKYPKNSNRRISNNPVNKKENQLIFSPSQIKYNKNNNKKLYQSVTKYII
jgi:hypothetical protein